MSDQRIDVRPVTKALKNLVSEIRKFDPAQHPRDVGHSEATGHFTATGAHPSTRGAQDRQDPKSEGEPIFHGTGAKAAKSIMESGLQVSFSDKDNYVPNVIYAATDRRDALFFAGRSSEEQYALITIDSSLAGSEPSTSSRRGELMFSQNIPAEAITKIEIYDRGFQRKDDRLVDTIEKAEGQASQLYIAAEITGSGTYSIMGFKKSDDKGNFGPLIKALADLANEVGKLVHITKEDGSGHLASGDFFTPTYGPSRDEEDENEILSVVKAFDPGLHPRDLGHEAASGQFIRTEQLSGKEMFNYQDEHIEHIPKKMGENVPEGMDYEPGRWLGLHAEGTGDVFRELALRSDNAHGPDWNYVEEKLQRLERDLGGKRDREILLFGELGEADETSRGKLISLWEDLPFTLSPDLEAAVQLNLALLKRDEAGIHQYIDEVRANKP